jgi:hypothetical protein
MEIVSILRLLWRARRLVVVFGLLAMFVGLLMAYQISYPPSLKSRQYSVGLGAVTALVDTPSSQIVDLGGSNTPGNVGTLSSRAALLASIMTSSPIKDEIAARARISPDTLIAMPPASTTPGAQPTHVSGASISAKDPRAAILKASIPNVQTGEIPIIAVETQAPTAAAAARLANASIEILKQRLSSEATSDAVPDARRVVVRQLGPARSATEVRGPGKAAAIIAAIFVFLLGCALIVGLNKLAGSWQSAAAQERADADELSAQESELALFDVEDDEEYAAGLRRAG